MKNSQMLSRVFGIPISMLKRRMRNDDYSNKILGPFLGKKLEIQIKKLQKYGCKFENELQI